MNPPIISHIMMAMGFNGETIKVSVDAATE
jgi:hypothetical protein